MPSSLASKRKIYSLEFPQPSKKTRENSSTFNLEFYAAGFESNIKMLCLVEDEDKDFEIEVKHSFSGHAAATKKLLITNQGMLVSASLDHTICIWDTSSGELIRSISCDHYINDMIWWQNNDYLIEGGGGSEHSINIIKYDTGIVEASLKGHTKMVGHLVMVGPSTLLSTSSDNTCRLWDLNTRKCIQVYHLAEECVIYAITLIRDSIVASSTSDKQLKFWDGVSGDCFTTIHSSFTILALDVCYKRNVLVSASDDNYIHLWNIEHLKHVNQPVISMLNPYQCSISCVKVVHGDEDLLLSGDVEGSILLWDLKTKEILKHLPRTCVNWINSFELIAPFKQQQYNAMVAFSFSRCELCDVVIESFFDYHM